MCPAAAILVGGIAMEAANAVLAQMENIILVDQDEYVLNEKTFMDTIYLLE